MGSLDIDFLFTDIRPEETIDIFTNKLFENTEKVESLSKIEVKDFYPLPPKILVSFLMESSTSKSIESTKVNFRSEVG